MKTIEQEWNAFKGPAETVLIFDAAFHLIDCSDSVLTLKNKTRDQLIGKDWKEFLVDSEQQDRLDTCQKVIETGQTFYTEYPLVVQGKERHIEMKAFKMGNGLAIIENDVSTKALKQSESRLKEAERIAHLGYYDIDLPTGLTKWSEETFRIFEMDPAKGAPTTANFRNLIFIEDRERIIATFKRAVDEVAAIDVTYRSISAKGNVRYVHSLAEIETNIVGESVRIFGTIQDVTVQKELELELIVQKEFVQKIANHSPSIIFILNIAQKQNIFVNQATQSILGYSVEEFKEKKDYFVRQIISAFSVIALVATEGKDYHLLDNLIHPEDKGAMIAIFKGVINSKENTLFECEYRMEHKDGYWIWFHGKLISFRRDKEGQVIEILGIGNDISKIKMAEIASKEAIIEAQEKEQERIAKDLHDAINPLLSVAKLNIDSQKKKWIEKKELEAANWDHVVNLLDKSMAEIKGIVSNLMPSALLDFGLPSALEELCEKVSAGEIFQLKLVTHGLKDRLSKKLEITLFRIAQELLNNVIKHAKASEVELQLIRHKKSIVLMIIDNGIGMKEPLDRNAVKGYGLRNIRSRIKLIDDSTMEVDSTKGRGTTITIELPVIQ